MKKKLILFMPSIEGGGVEKNFFIISNYLATKFDNVTLVTISKIHKNRLNKKIKIIAPNSNIFTNFGRRFKFIISIFYLFKEIVKNKDSTVLCFQGLLYCTFFCKFFSTKIIIRSNSSPSGWSKNIIKNYLYRSIYGWADKIIVNSLDFKNELFKRFKLESICIYNPLNKKEILKDSKKNIRINFFENKSYKLISVARFTEQKDHECLVKAINLLKDKYRIRLLLLGYGPTQKKIETLINNFKLKKNIKILPFQNNPYPFIKKSQLFILSSKYEGLPNSLLEAIVLNKPVISSNCPSGPKEILDNGKGGLLFPIGDYKSLAKKIELFTKNQIIFFDKKKYAKRRLERFNYKKRLNDYATTINGL